MLPLLLIGSLLLALSYRRRRPSDEDRARAAKFRRGLPIPTRGIGDKKLRGQLRHSEKLAAEAAAQAAKAEEWLLPNEAGGLEAEGLERTWRFSQVLCPPSLYTFVLFCGY